MERQSCATSVQSCPMNNVHRKRGCQMKSLSRNPSTVHVFRHRPCHGNAPSASSRYRAFQTYERFASSIPSSRATSAPGARHPGSTAPPRSTLCPLRRVEPSNNSRSQNTINTTFPRRPLNRGNSKRVCEQKKEVKKLLAVLCAFALVGAFSTAALSADSDVALVSLTIDPYIAISFDDPDACFDLVVTDGGAGDCDTECWTARSNLGSATLGVVLVVPPGAPGAWTAVMAPAGPIGPGVTLGSLEVCVSGITLLDEAPAAYAGGSVTITIAPYTTGNVVMR